MTGLARLHVLHVVDMADRDDRATYTALSSSVVGLILLAGGVFGVLAQWLGIGAVLALFTSMAALAIFSAVRLDDVQAAEDSSSNRDARGSSG